MRGPISTAVALTAAAVLLQPASAARSACGGGLAVCSTVTVPLDRSGRVPGTVTLHVEVVPTLHTPPRGTIFLVAGGPGQGSAASFDLGSPTSAEFFRSLFPGYTLVAFDNRGTGGSGVLTCPNDPATDAATTVAGCATTIGAVRDFYATPDHVEDLEAVRQALGVDRIAIFGVSYGTKLALAYAAAHPDHVERLLLDSVLPLDRPDPFGTDELRAMPSTLAQYCPGTACKAATPDFSGEVVALANALAAKPLAGLGAADFLELVYSADLSPGLDAELPAAVHAARLGSPKPLLRLAKIANRQSSEEDVSLGLYLATTCHDGTFPWEPGASLADRASSIQGASAGLLGPFGSWALPLGSAYTCLGWPTPAAGTSVAAQPLPDVPVLALSGGLDLRTPTAWAASVVAQFPQGHLLVVPGVGHSVLTTDPSGCSADAVLDWLNGSTPTTRCPRAKPYVTTVPSYPTNLPAHLGAGRTLTVAAQTLHDAEAIWFMAAADSAAASATEPGLDGGTLVAGRTSFRLRNYAITPRVALSGVIRMSLAAAPLEFSGTVTVSGPGAAHGTLVLRDGKLVGKLR